MIVESAHSPILNEDGTIDLMIKFRELENEIPFTANATDVTELGRQIHTDAVFGIYGIVSPNE